METQVQTKKRRGFAIMDKDVVREISRKGGRAAHVAGTAHEFTSEEARAAGRKGGLAVHAKRAARVTETSVQTTDSTSTAVTLE